MLLLMTCQRVGAQKFRYVRVCGTFCTLVLRIYLEREQYRSCVRVWIIYTCAHLTHTHAHILHTQKQSTIYECV